MPIPRDTLLGFAVCVEGVCLEHDVLDVDRVFALNAVFTIWIFPVTWVGLVRHVLKKFSDHKKKNIYSF